MVGNFSGKELRKKGYSFFRADKDYHIGFPGEDGIVEVTSWCGEDGPDADGFGREEYYDWWLLDENLQESPGIPKWHSFSRHDMRNHEKEWAALRKKAAATLKNR